MTISINDEVTIDGITKRFRDWCDDYNINPALAQRRVNVQKREIVEAITAPRMSYSQRGRVNSRRSPWRR